jgi:TatD DNase family protein
LFINIHTHQAQAVPSGTVEILNFYSDFRRVAAGVQCSIGLHPWYLNDHSRLTDELQQYAALPNVLAIGECGLDKVCNTPWELQTNVFKQQIHIANTLGKPLIIHCVRAYDQFLNIIKTEKPTVPVIMHGFNKNARVAGQLLSAGIYLSFGAAILNDLSPAAAALQQVPPEMFFLETDDAIADIATVYKKAASIRNISEEDITLQLQQNFHKVFNLPA